MLHGDAFRSLNASDTMPIAASISLGLPSCHYKRVDDDVYTYEPLNSTSW